MAIQVCGIVGVGLIGGSLGLALRARGASVVALDESPASLEGALRRGAADRGSTDPSILEQADLVVICTPPRAIVDAAARVLPHLKTGSLLADFGSVKAPIVQQIESLPTSGVRFIGLHPMCGTAGQGIEAAREDLFAGAVLIATPTARTASSALDDVAELASLLKMRLVRLTPEEHDRQIALLSHLPYLVSVALTRLAPGFESAGPSFREATRVAMSPPALWEEILALNRSQVLPAVDLICEELARLADLQGERLENALEQARSLRTRWQLASGEGSSPDAQRKDGS